MACYRPGLLNSDPVGFKILVIAQLSFFDHWLWHIKDVEHGAVDVEISTQTLSGVGDPGHVWDEQGSIFGSTYCYSKQ